MDNELALRCMRQKYGSPRRMMQVLGMDANPDDLNDPSDPDKLAFIQSKLSNDDFLQYIRLLIAGARRGASDRRAARDAERVGNLQTGELREGVTESAEQAQDAKPASADETFKQMFGSYPVPGTC